MTILLNVLLLSFLLPISSADWSQQYGDSSSSDYTELVLSSNAPPPPSNWNYTSNEEYSIFYGSPAVSEKGYIYFSYLEYPQYWLQLRAVSPNGSLHWMANFVGGDDDCSVVFMTNVVYCQQRDLVIVGWTCLDAGAYYQKQGQVVAYDAKTGQTKWRSEMLYDASDMGTLSIDGKRVFVSGGYSCGRDGGAAQPPHHKNTSQIVVLDLTTGKTLQSFDYEYAGCSSQSKVFIDKDGSTHVLFSVNLAILYKKLNGSVLSLKCDSTQCKRAWLNHIKVSWDARYAFSKLDGFIYGSYGLMGTPDTVFGLDHNTGKVVFTNKGYCNEGAYPSGPAVDINGNAYYSCGNTVFSINNKGSLRWKSDKFTTSPGYSKLYLLKHNPAIVHSKNMLLTVTSDSASLVSLNMENGKVMNTFNVPSLSSTDDGVREPPIIAGNSVYLIRARDTTVYYLFSYPLSDVVGF